MNWVQRSPTMVSRTDYLVLTLFSHRCREQYSRYAAAHEQIWWKIWAFVTNRIEILIYTLTLNVDHLSPSVADHLARKNSLLEQLVQSTVFWTGIEDWKQYTQRWLTCLLFQLSVVDLFGNSQRVLGSNPSSTSYFSYSHTGQMAPKFCIRIFPCSWSNLSLAY